MPTHLCASCAKVVLINSAVTPGMAVKVPIPSISPFTNRGIGISRENKVITRNLNGPSLNRAR